MVEEADRTHDRRVHWRNVPMTQLPDSTNQAPPTLRGIPDAATAHWQRQTDVSHLKMLSIFYYIFAGLQALGGCIGVFYIFMGLMFSNAPPPSSTLPSSQQGPPPEFFGILFSSLGGCLVLVSLVFATLTVYAAYCLSRQQHKTYCMVIAGICCLSIPLGTILGVFTFIVLGRPSVAALFQERQNATSPVQT
jgi:hypothetical protein